LTDTDKQNSTGKYKNSIQIRKSKQPKIQQNKNYPGSVASYNTWPGNDVGLFYNAPEPTWGGETLLRA